MKYKLITLFIIVFVITGCSSKTSNNYICTMDVDSTSDKIISEKVEISFNDKDNLTRQVYAYLDETITVEDDVSDIIDLLRQNYCNNELKGNYFCDVLRGGNYLLLKETGNTKDILGTVKNNSVDKNVKNLKEKGFSCKLNKK